MTDERIKRRQRIEVDCVWQCLRHKLKIVANKDEQTLKFARQFGDFSESAGQIYLIDPLGNLMMTYTKGYDPKGLRSDLTRLLKNSWAG